MAGNEKTSPDPIVATGHKQQQAAKPQRIVPPQMTTPVQASAKDELRPLEYLSVMQQGMVVWSKDGECEFFNQQMVELNEMSQNQMYLGLKRTSMLHQNTKRGTKDSITQQELEQKFASGGPFDFDRHTRSGRTILATAQPRRCGGYVVTFSDVTEKRLYEVELDTAKREAELSKEQAQHALTVETRRKRQAKLLGELGEWLQSCKSLDELYKVIARFMETLFSGSEGELFVYNNSRDVLESACYWKACSAKNHIDADDCWALRRGRIFKYGFGIVDFPCSHVHADKADGGPYVCLPIVAHGDTVGLLHIDFTDWVDSEMNSQQADEDTIKFAIMCSEQISLAIANVRLRDELRDQSTKDPLTGLFNRRYFLESCRNAFASAQRNNGSVGIISCDADNFKHFNDTHGHDAGDMVLRAVSKIMQTHCANIGVPCRYGGEEFTIVLPDTSLEASVEFAELIRAEVSELSIRYGDSKLPNISISVGVANYPQFGQTPQDVLSAADQALYKAKAQGANCVVTAKK
jgi:diguanylate cyclase (GGDEF)-like protein